MKKVLVLGATSAIARSIAAELACRGYSLLLAGRSEAELEHLASDLEIRHQVDVSVALIDAEDAASHGEFVTGVAQLLGEIDGVVYAIGLLGDQPLDSIDGPAARHLIEVNLSSAVSLLAPLSNLLAEQGKGFILGLSSVAGDRGKQSNYAYCAAKAGLSVYLDGLRNRLESRGVRVYTLKLGFVDTAMTYGMKGLPMLASPQQIGRQAVRLLDSPSGTYYLPWFWRWLMLLIRMIPERIFKRMRL